MSQCIVRGMEMLLTPPADLYADQTEQRTRSWLYDSVSDGWVDDSAVDNDTISRTNYAAAYYNTIEWLQFRIPGNVLVQGRAPSQIKLKLKVYDGQDQATTDVYIAATSEYRKTSGLAFTNFDGFPGAGGLTDLDITALCASIDKGTDWYIQLQMALVGAVTADSISLWTKTTGSYIPYLELTY